MPGLMLMQLCVTIKSCCGTVCWIVIVFGQWFLFFFCVRFPLMQHHDTTNGNNSDGAIRSTRLIRFEGNGKERRGPECQRHSLAFKFDKWERANACRGGRCLITIPSLRHIWATFAEKRFHCSPRPIKTISPVGQQQKLQQQRWSLVRAGADAWCAVVSEMNESRTPCAAHGCCAT